MKQGNSSREKVSFLKYEQREIEKCCHIWVVICKYESAKYNTHSFVILLIFCSDLCILKKLSNFKFFSKFHVLERNCKKTETEMKQET